MLQHVELVRAAGDASMDLARQSPESPNFMTNSDENPPVPATVKVHPALAGALARQGYATLTPVQMAVLEGKAGRQRPARFGPDRIRQDGGLRPRASRRRCSAIVAIAGPAERPLGLIIAPTRELALQVERELQLALCRCRARSRRAAWAAWTCARSIRQLDRGAHIVVGTPGRLRDHITKGSLDLTELRAVVLDEADEMLDMGFREDLEFILAAAPEDRRTLMFSATVPKQIAQLAQTYQRDALRIVATGARTPCRHRLPDGAGAVARARERHHQHAALLRQRQRHRVLPHARGSEASGCPAG